MFEKDLELSVKLLHNYIAEEEFGSTYDFFLVFEDEVGYSYGD